MTRPPNQAPWPLPTSPLKRSAPPQPTGYVPPVVSVAGIANPIHRNNTINQSYHAFDLAMTAYMGLPEVANWCTYGKHASREAGLQIRNLQHALDVLSDCGPALARFTATHGRHSDVWSIARRLLQLLDEEGLAKQSLLLAFARARITEDDVNDFKDAWSELTNLEWTDLIPGVFVYEQLNATLRATPILGKLAGNVRTISHSVGRIHSNMTKGNRQIYENLAPAYNTYLREAAKVGGRAVDLGRMTFGGDPRGFLKAAFTKYSQARQVVEDFAASPLPVALEKQRNALMHEGNMLIGFQEQLLILQPIFDTMMEELTAMNGTMVLRDPNGVHELVDNWGHFYTRMGVDTTTAPSNPNAVRPGGIPATKPVPGEKYTISKYFEEYLANGNTHTAPDPIAPHPNER